MIFEADDAWRKSNPESADTLCADRVMNAEPKLTDGVVWSDEKFHSGYFKKGASCPFITASEFITPDELEAVARHMRWRKSRAAEREAGVPAFTEEMARDVWTEWSLPKPNGHHTFIELARLMNEKLDARRKGQK
jgi:hypothetical protein